MNDRHKKDKKLQKNLEKNQSMSMSCFLRRILGIRDANFKAEEITHDDIAKIFPNIKRTSFSQILDNVQTVYCGEVVLVRDIRNNVVPYIMPNNLQDLDELGMDNVMDKEEWADMEFTQKSKEVTELKDYNLKTMSTYDLEQLLKIYRATEQMGCYYVVRSELIKRPDSIQGSRKSKQKAKRRELRFGKKKKEEDY